MEPKITSQAVLPGVIRSDAPATVHGPVAEELIARLEARQFRQARGTHSEVAAEFHILLQRDVPKFDLSVPS